MQHAATPLGLAIQLARVARGLTQARLAQVIGLSSRYQVYEWEQGYRVPTQEMLGRLINTLELPVLQDLIANHSDRPEASETAQ